MSRIHSLSEGILWEAIVSSNTCEEAKVVWNDLMCNYQGKQVSNKYTEDSQLKDGLYQLYKGT